MERTVYFSCLNKRGNLQYDGIKLRYRLPKRLLDKLIKGQKRLPATRETWVRSLGREDRLEKDLATTPVFLPGESHGQRSLVGCSPQGCKELDTTERLHFQTGKNNPFLFQQRQKMMTYLLAHQQLCLAEKHFLGVVNKYCLIFPNRYTLTSALQITISSLLRNEK